MEIPTAPELVPRHAGIHVLCPAIDTTRQILDLLEACLSEQFDCLGTSSTHLAMNDNFVGRIELILPRTNLTKGNQNRVG